jgi:DNA-binding winged helix-turn-helix (wHTH) protein/dipeptidyl aminopeptidase/acylaminoacyl peptidase
METRTNSRAREAGNPHALRFGAFEMDLRSGELRRNGIRIRLQPQPFKVLALLASRPGEVVTREEIQEEIWPAGTFVDFKQSLNFCIRQIRAVLGDSAAHPRFVETLPRRGYRWVGGAVESLGPPAPHPEGPRPVPIGGPADESPSSTVAPRGSRWPRVALVAAAVLMGALALAYRLGGREPAEGHPHFERITFRRGALTSARFGPERQVVYVAEWEGEPWRMHLANDGARASLRLSARRAQIVAASDTEVAFLRDEVLARAPLAGGPPREVARGISAADWTPDTANFAVVRRRDQRFHLEYPIGSSLGEIHRVSTLRVSPDGERLALAEHPVRGDDRGRVVILDKDGVRLAVTEDFASLDGLAWAPNGGEVWFTAARVGAKNELHGVALDGQARTIHAGVGRLVLHDLAPDGRVLLESADARGETILRREGDGEERDLSWLDFSGPEGISASGDVVLLVESGDGGGPDYTSFLRPTDGSPPVRLGPGRAMGLSPDGSRVLMVPLRNPDHVEIVPTGPGEPRRVRIPGAVSHEMAGWVGGGEAFYVTTRDTSRAWHTWLVDVENEEHRRLPLPEDVRVYRNTFSPDGREFVARCPEAASHCIYATDGGDPRPLAGADPEWMPVAWDTQSRVWFRDRTEPIPELLWRVDLSTQERELVSEVAPADPAGVLGLTRVVVAQSGDAWAYSFVRRLSDLYVVTGLD